MYSKKDVAAIKKYLLRHEETLAVAESVTSGHLQAAFSLADNALKFFQGGITAYNVGQKARHLQVDPIYALACNSVSERTAIEMARRVCYLFSSDWGIGITGYAAPVPELNVHTLFAFYAISYREKVVCADRIESKKRNVKEVQQFYALTVLNDFSLYLSGEEKRNAR